MFRFSDFLADTHGGNTISNVLMTAGFLMIGGLALDTANAWRIKSLLQTTADASALAAATKVPDAAAAAALARSLAATNMSPDRHGEVVGIADVEVGIWDAATRTFTPTMADPDAVRVVAGRHSATGNGVGTYLLKLAGFDGWDIGVDAIARVRLAGDVVSCAGATILTESSLDTGGGNTIGANVCLHGETGVTTGGSDFYDPATRISAADVATLNINWTLPGSAQPEDVKMEQSLSAAILPQLGSMFDTFWFELWGAATPTYEGTLLPDTLFTAPPQIVEVDAGGWWTAGPGDLVPNTIYVVNHGMAIAGGVSATNVAIIARGQIGTGGGAALNFRDVYFFAEGALNFSDDVVWGDPSSFCDSGKFNTYLFSETSLTLGGFGGASAAWGVIGAAPQFSPGGALASAGGIYIEAAQYTSLGGNMNIAGCETTLEANIETATPEPVQTIVGAVLVN